jgi:hypothetical protein
MRLQVSNETVVADGEIGWGTAHSSFQPEVRLRDRLSSSMLKWGVVVLAVDNL